MGLRIQTNVQSLMAQKNLGISTKNNEESMEKVSSGYRINKASDDAAGLAISDRLKSDIRGLNMAKRNANDGISVIQTAEGGMNEITNILTRLRELSVQGASDTIGNTERGFIHKEFNSLKDEIDRITVSTEYNGTMLLSGGLEGLPESLSKHSNLPPLEIQVGKNWNAETDGANAGGEYGRNPINVIRVNFDKMNTGTGVNGLNIGGSSDESIDSTGVFMAGNEKDSKLRAQQTITKLDQALEKVAGYRSDLGSVQSRLNSTVSNLSTQTENYSAANSRIRDTDFAEETAKLTQSNILKQAGVSILSQANQSPTAALSLLR
ncbi:MAG: flagellin [Bdellovibrionota bacterium]